MFTTDKFARDDGLCINFLHNLYLACKGRILETEKIVLDKRCSDSSS